MARKIEVVGHFLAELLPLDGRSMFVKADSNPPAAFSDIDFFAVLFVTENPINTIFCVTVYRRGYPVLITCGRSSDSGCSIKGKITILTSGFVTLPPPSMSRASSVDIIHSGSAQIMSEIRSLSESRHGGSRESVLELSILENHIRMMFGEDCTEARKKRGKGEWGYDPVLVLRNFLVFRF